MAPHRLPVYRWKNQGTDKLSKLPIKAKRVWKWARLNSNLGLPPDYYAVKEKLKPLMSFTNKIHAFIVQIVKIMEIYKNPGGNLYLPVYFWETEFGQGGGTRVSQTSPTDPRSGFLCRVVADL